MDILIKNHATRRRSLRGNVDRNEMVDIVRIYISVVPYVGTWIKIDSTPLWVVPLTIFRYKGDKLKKVKVITKVFLLSDKK